jgi:hypothetical protein
MTIATTAAETELSEKVKGHDCGGFDVYAMYRYPATAKPASSS